MVQKDKIYLAVCSVAILHEVPQTTSIDQAKIATVLSPPLGIAQAVTGTVSLSSPRDQLEAVLDSGKTDVRYLGGQTTTFTKSKIPVVLEFFVTNFALKIKSYGVNFVISLPHPDPQEWIAENLLSSTIAAKVGKQLLGGYALVSLKADRKTWNVKFEPTKDKKIAIDFNASETATILPSARQLRAELVKQWKDLTQLLDELGL